MAEKWSIPSGLGCVAKYSYSGSAIPNVGPSDSPIGSSWCVSCDVFVWSHIASDSKVRLSIMSDVSSLLVYET